MADTLRFRKGEVAGKEPEDYLKKAVANANKPTPLMTDTFWKIGVVRLPKDINPFSIRWDMAMRAHIQKFIAHYEKMGWQLTTRPVVRKVPVLPDGATLGGAQGIHESNPLVEEDRDMYEVGAHFKRRPQAAKLVLPDYMVDSLPAGLKVR